MKKFMIILIACILAASVGACSASVGAPGSPSRPPVVETTPGSIASGNDASGGAYAAPEVSEAAPSLGIDKTAEIDAFDISGKAVISETVAEPDFSRIYRNAAELSQVAEYIVSGEVLDVYYTDIDARPQIYYDFKITDVHRGDFNIDDIITIGEYGGYVRGSVFAEVYGADKFDEPLTDDDLIHYSFYTAPEPAVGEEYMLFMAASDILSDTYSLYGGFMGKYTISADAVTRYTPENQPYFYAIDSVSDDQETLADVITAVESTQLIENQATREP
ncbi:MAG: hypothetical protein LBT12_03435 [Oscillospiraceae bacterium]|jgi:hypothetical protein|nr:hypothetical protein [Oscillospiraceae bacterium]